MILPQPSKSSWLRAVWAFVLSFAAPGLGHVFARTWQPGLAILVANALNTFALVAFTRLVRPSTASVTGFYVWLGIAVVATIAVAVDAFRRARGATARPKPVWWRTTWFTGLVYFGLAIALGYPGRPGWVAYSIPSGSNAPNLIPGDNVFAEPLTGQVPSRGDVITFRAPHDPAVIYIKRVIGLPGDRVQLTKGRLIINGQTCPREARGNEDIPDAGLPVRVTRFSETLPNGVRYDIYQMTDGVEPGGNGQTPPLDLNNTPEYLVPNGHLFVLGDNRDNSADSRILDQIGYIPIANVMGRARVIFWSRTWSRVLQSLD